jgi:hypothetical protein
MHTLFHSNQGGSGRVREGKDNPRESGSPKETRDDLFKPREHSVDVIGLGIIAALIYGCLASSERWHPEAFSLYGVCCISSCESRWLGMASPEAVAERTSSRMIAVCAS